MKSKNWYFNRDLKPQGPHSLEEMRELIHSGDIGPHDLICHDVDGAWKVASEWGVFERTLFPATQEYMPGQEFVADEKEWVLLASDDGGKTVLQEGPFSLADLRRSLEQRLVSDQQYIWKPGLSGWSRIADRPEFR